MSRLLPPARWLSTTSSIALMTVCLLGCDAPDVPDDWYERLTAGQEWEITASGRVQTLQLTGRELTITHESSRRSLFLVGLFLAAGWTFCLYQVLESRSLLNPFAVASGIVMTVLTVGGVYITRTSELRLAFDLGAVHEEHSYLFGLYASRSSHVRDELEPASWRVAEVCDDDGCDHDVRITLPLETGRQLHLLEIGHTGGGRPDYDRTQEHRATEICEELNERLGLARGPTPDPGAR